MSTGTGTTCGSEGGSASSGPVKSSASSGESRGRERDARGISGGEYALEI